MCTTSTFLHDSCVALVYDCLITLNHLFGHEATFGAGYGAGVGGDDFQADAGQCRAAFFQAAVFEAADFGFRPAHGFADGLLPARRKGVQYRPLVLAGGFTLGGG
nr:MAG TPA: hypothetical protein [Caudoviricetes sp.]